MIRHVLIGLCAATALSACSKSPDTDSDAHAEAVVAKAEASPDSTLKRGLPVGTTPTKPLAPTALPPAFEGHWGMRAADCDISRADTRGLLIVKGNTMTFYTAIATTKVVGGQSRFKVIADLSYKGEGKEWQTRETLELTAAGTVLMRTVLMSTVLMRTGPSPAKTYRYVRC